MAILEAEGIEKSFYDPALVSILSGIDLTLHSGESIAIMGPSGEGKSTLLHILGTLEDPSRGRLQIQGKEVTPGNLAAFRNDHIGFIFQAFHLLEDYTALENVLMPARIARRASSPGSLAYQHAEGLLGEVGLHDRMHYSTKLLSGGEKQRVAIARALCNNPEIILADEPSGNLDHASSQAIHELLFRCCTEHGKGLIVVTHDQHLAAQCDKVYWLQEGKLKERT